MRAFRIFCGVFVTQTAEDDVYVMFEAFLCVLCAQNTVCMFELRRCRQLEGLLGDAASIVRKGL